MPFSAALPREMCSLLGHRRPGQSRGGGDACQHDGGQPHTSSCPRAKKAGGHAGRGSLRKVCVEAPPFAGFHRAIPRAPTIPRIHDRLARLPRPCSGSALALVLALGAALRADRLGLEELTTDEAFSWRMATHPPPTSWPAPPPTCIRPSITSPWRPGRPSPGFAGGPARPLAAPRPGRGGCSPIFSMSRSTRSAQTEAERGGRWGAVAAALLVALHADQVGHSRHVRMYALGIALAGLTAWLMLRALRSGRPRWPGGPPTPSPRPPCATRTTTAASPSPPSLAFAGVFLASRVRAPAVRPRDVLGLLAAALAHRRPVRALALRCSGGRPRASARTTGSARPAPSTSRARSCAGRPGSNGRLRARPHHRRLCRRPVLGLWRGDRGQRFLALQAALPWVGALGLSWAPGRTLFLERYLFFSQLALLVFLARGLGGARALAAARRRRRAWHPCSRSASRTRSARGRRRSRPPRTGRASWRGRSGRGDLVLANAPRDLNVVRYYLMREGAAGIEMKCPASRSVGHLSQVSSITAEEIVGEESVWAGPWSRVWRVRLHPPRKWRPDPPPPRVGTRLHPGVRGSRRHAPVSDSVSTPYVRRACDSSHPVGRALTGGEVRLES